MGKLGKSVLKQKPPKPRKLSEAEIELLEEYQEKLKELAEQRKAERLEAEQESETQKLKSEAPEVIDKDERIKAEGLMEQLNRLAPEDDSEEEKPLFPHFKKKVVKRPIIPRVEAEDLLEE